MISLLVFVNKKESINALVLYRSSIDELAPLSSDITENTNIKINYKSIYNLPYGKMYWFARLSGEKYRFEQVKSVPKNKLIGCVYEKCTDKYSDIYDQMESSYKFSPIDNNKDEIHSMTFEQLYQKATRTYYDGEH